MAARRAHNPKVVGSNPTPATNYSSLNQSPRNFPGAFVFGLGISNRWVNVRRVAKRPKAGPPVNCPSGSLALPVLLKDFLFDRRIQECSPATIRDYRDELKSFIRFLSDRGCVQAVQVAPFHVRSFLAHLQDLGRAPTTVNRGFGNIRTFFNWMVYEDYLAVSPCAKIKAAHVPQVIKPLISRAQ